MLVGTGLHTFLVSTHAFFGGINQTVELVGYRVRTCSVMVDNAKLFTIGFYVLSFYAWPMLNYNAYKNILDPSKTDIYKSFRILTSEVFFMLCRFQHIHHSYKM